MELALKALADATFKFYLDHQANEGSVLSNDLSRSSDGVKCVGSKPPTSDSDSSMLDGLSTVETNDDDDNDDDGSDRLSKANTTKGQGSEKLRSTSTDYENTSSPVSPFRKKKDFKETFVRDEQSSKKRRPKKIKTITLDKYGRRTSNRLKSPSPLIKAAAPITKDGDVISL